MKAKMLQGIVLLLAGVAYAQPVSLIDASFESAFSGSNGVVGTGWFSFADGNNARGGVSLDGISGSDGGDPAFFAAMSPLDGARGGFLTSVNEFDGNSVYQAVTLEAGTEYRLTFALGTNSIPAVGRSDAKYGVVIFNSAFTSQQAGSLGTITADGNTFADYSVAWTPTTTATYHVGLRNLGYVSGTGIDNSSVLFFDNARLEVIPEPGTFVLVSIFGLVGLYTLRRQQS